MKRIILIVLTILALSAASASAAGTTPAGRDPVLTRQGAIAIAQTQAYINCAKAAGSGPCFAQVIKFGKADLAILNRFYARLRSGNIVRGSACWTKLLPVSTTGITVGKTITSYAHNKVTKGALVTAQVAFLKKFVAAYKVC